MSNLSKRINLSCGNLFDRLYSLESVLQFTRSVCQEKEFTSTYYNLGQKYKYILSEERNHYINMLNIALDRVSDIKEINGILEKEIFELQQNSNDCSGHITT